MAAHRRGETMTMIRKHPLSLAEQIEQVRKIGESPMVPLIAAICGVASAIGIVLFNAVESDTPGVFALFFAILSGSVSLAVLVNLPRFQRIARATRSGRRVRGDIQVMVDHSDPDDVKIRGSMVEGGAVWELEFTRPLGWEPRSGEWPCELVYIADVRLPVMVQLAEGLLLTSSKSRRVYGRGR
jgi:hypothetical protein